jgi:hypothetical protein
MECNREASIMRRPRPTGAVVPLEQKAYWWSYQPTVTLTVAFPFLQIERVLYESRLSPAAWRNCNRRTFHAVFLIQGNTVSLLYSDALYNDAISGLTYVIDKWVWNAYGIILTGEYQSTRRGNYPTVALFTSNPTETEMGSKPILHGEKPTTNCLSDGTVCYTK